jgi:hypothetical protein
MRNRMLLVILAMFLISLSTVIHAQAPWAAGIPTVDVVSTWKQCREYLPDKDGKDCRVDFDMLQTKDGKNPPQTHRDISVWLGPNGRGVVTLWNSSPFASCSLATTPGPLGRDGGTNVASLLTTLGTFAGISVPPGAAPAEANAQEFAEFLNQGSVADRLARIFPNTAAPPPQKIEDEEVVINKLFAAFYKAKTVYDAVPYGLKDLRDIRVNLQYAYGGDTAARSAIQAIQKAIVDFVSRTFPDPAKTIPSLQQQLDGINDELDKFEKANPGDQDVHAYVTATKQGPLTRAKASLQSVTTPAEAVQVTYLSDMAPKVQKILDFLQDWTARDQAQTVTGEDGKVKSQPNASVQILPIAIYPESKVAVQIKCVDAVTNTPLFDSISFNAFFQKPPSFDISSGLVISLLQGRQATTEVVNYVNPGTGSGGTTPPPTPTTEVIIQRTRPQFIPGVFAEWHPINFKLPWVHDPAIDQQAVPPGTIPTWMSDNVTRHALGYVGSLGLAGGIMANPNNGTTQAEFFEGISFGIQRFVFLIGNHTGRSQNLTNGYYEFAPVTAGTVIPTVSNWGNGLAFGITYRIPLR